MGDSHLIARFYRFAQLNSPQHKTVDVYRQVEQKCRGVAQCYLDQLMNLEKLPEDARVPTLKKSLTMFGLHATESEVLEACKKEIGFCVPIPPLHFSNELVRSKLPIEFKYKGQVISAKKRDDPARTARKNAIEAAGTLWTFRTPPALPHRETLPGLENVESCDLRRVDWATQFGTSFERVSFPDLDSDGSVEALVVYQESGGNSPGYEGSRLIALRECAAVQLASWGREAKVLPGGVLESTVIGPTIRYRLRNGRLEVLPAAAPPSKGR